MVYPFLYSFAVLIAILVAIFFIFLISLRFYDRILIYSGSIFVQKYAVQHSNWCDCVIKLLFSSLYNYLIMRLK